MRAIIAFILSFTLFAQQSPAQQIRLPATQDNSIVLNDGEWKVNAGQQARVRAKGNQHIIAMAFDTTAIQGKRIRGATLVCTPSDQKIQGVTISTIATRWDENRSNGLTAGIDGIVDWGYPQARFPAVCGGNDFTLTSHTLSRIEEDRYHWDISPDLVHALSIGIARGLAIHEHDADYGLRKPSSQPLFSPVVFAPDQNQQPSDTRCGLACRVECLSNANSIHNAVHERTRSGGSNVQSYRAERSSSVPRSANRSAPKAD